MGRKIFRVQLSEMDGTIFEQYDRSTANSSIRASEASIRELAVDLRVYAIRVGNPKGYSPVDGVKWFDVVGGRYTQTWQLPDGDVTVVIERMV